MPQLFESKSQQPLRTFWMGISGVRESCGERAQAVKRWRFLAGRIAEDFS